MTLAYSDDGPSQKPCLLFLHAFPYHGGMWDRQRAALSDIARTITLDVRGVRASTPAAPYMLEHLVDDVLGLLDELAIDAAILCGLSMGGYVALRTAERAPERVRALFLADTQAAADSTDAKLARAAAIRNLTVGGVSDFVEAQLARALSGETHRDQPAIVDEARAIIRGCNPAALTSALVALATRTDTHEALRAMAMPTRVVVGEHDTITPVSAARELVAQLPRADLHVLAGAGHISNLERPDEFNRLLRAFVLAHGERAPAH